MCQVTELEYHDTDFEGQHVKYVNMPNIYTRKPLKYSTGTVWATKVVFFFKKETNTNT